MRAQGGCQAPSPCWGCRGGSKVIPGVHGWRPSSGFIQGRSFCGAPGKGVSPQLALSSLAGAGRGEPWEIPPPTSSPLVAPTHQLGAYPEGPSLACGRPLPPLFAPTHSAPSCSCPPAGHRPPWGEGPLLVGGRPLPVPPSPPLVPHPPAPAHLLGADWGGSLGRPLPAFPHSPSVPPHPAHSPPPTCSCLSWGAACLPGAPWPRPRVPAAGRAWAELDAARDAYTDFRVSAGQTEPLRQTAAASAPCGSRRARPRGSVGVIGRAATICCALQAKTSAGKQSPSGPERHPAVT